MGLKRIFLTFFLQLLLSLAGVFCLWICILFVLGNTGFFQPANAVERQVIQWIAEVEKDKVISLEHFPAKAEFALFDEKMELVSTNMNGKSLEKARSLALSDGRFQMNEPYYAVYKKVVASSQVIIIKYEILASAAHPIFAKADINIELVFVLLLMGLVFLDIAFFVIHYARKLEKELAVLQDAAEQIKSQNLDFKIKRTKIKEFNRVLDSLDILKTELETSLFAKWELEQLQKSQMSALAHDIKTPLTILRGNAELLEESALDDGQREYVDSILTHTNRIQEYASQIIEVSRQNLISYSVRQPCFLLKFLSDIETDFKNMGKDKKLNFCIQTDGNLPKTIDTNVQGIRRVLWNILDNAVFYSPSNGVITLSVFTTTDESAGLTLVFRVSDEGDGFSEEALKYVATEFYRGDKSRSENNRFGMGLAIARQILSQLDGGLAIKNGEQKGAIVEVGLRL